MPKPIRVTDTNNSFQKSSEGEVSFVRPKEVSPNMKQYLNEDAELRRTFYDQISIETADSRKRILIDRFPVDDEHELNKI